jgi:UDP-glucuronate decarboxylase
LAENIFNIVDPSGKYKINYMPIPSDDPIKRKPDITKAIQTLNWKPSIKLQEGLKKTIEYFKKS